MKFPAVFVKKLPNSPDDFIILLGPEQNDAKMPGWTTSEGIRLHYNDYTGEMEAEFNDGYFTDLTKRGWTQIL